MIGFSTDPVLGPCFIIDSTSLEPITTCPYHGYLSVVKKKKPSYPATALIAGNILHEALSYRYKMMAYRSCKTSAIINFTNEGLPITLEEIQLRLLSKLYSRYSDIDMEWRNLALATELIKTYNEVYEDENFTIAKHNSRPFVELPFSVICERIDGILVIYIGKIDLAYFDHKNHLYILDHKTSSRLGETFWDEASVFEQTRGYCWAATKCGLPQPTGYTVNALGWKAPTKTGTAINLERRTYYLEEDSLSRWYQNMLLQCETFIWHHKRGKYPTHQKLHCIHKYGRCEFYNLCKQHPASHDDALSSNYYIDNTWNPLK